MPYIEGIADKPEPDHCPVRKEISVEERILTACYHHHGPKHRIKRLGAGEVLTAKKKDSYKNGNEPQYREHVAAETDAVCL